MQITPTISWKLARQQDDEALDPRLLPLLDAIATTASLAAAVVECGISYRAGWGLLRDYRYKLAAPLVTFERGRGATLTALGKQLLRAHATAAQRLGKMLPELAIDLGPEAPSAPAAPAVRLSVAASHDLALSAFSETLQESAGLVLDISVMGSLNGLRDYAEERVEMAGFHVPTGTRALSDLEPYLACLHARRDALIRFVDREQGLILPRGNPMHVRSFRDVVEKGLRFVNRQRGSGTRLLIDRIVAHDGIDPSAVNGFNREEFTHPAVAATVASGGADAGFGLRAAAAEHNLAFIPVVRERYFFAIRSKDLSKPPISRLIAAMRNAAFGRAVRRLPGYHPTGAGTVSGLEALE